MPVFKSIYEASNALQQVVKFHPDLCASGFSYPGRKSANFDAEKAKLLLPVYTLGFWLVCEFLMQQPRLPRIQNKQGTYDLKHQIEKYYGFYIPNGAVIGALIHCGFRIRRYKNRPSVDGNFQPYKVSPHYIDRSESEIASCWPPEALAVQTACRAISFDSLWEDFERTLSLVEA